MAKGKVEKLNPPENQGFIVIDGGTDEYVFSIKAGHTVGGYSPKLNEAVNFTPNDPSKVATEVSKFDGCTLSSNPASLPASGGSIRLTYTTDNAIRADIQPGIGAVNPAGGTTELISVKQTTTFTLTTYDGMTRTPDVCSVKVIVG